MENLQTINPSVDDLIILIVNNTNPFEIQKIKNEIVTQNKKNWSKNESSLNPPPAEPHY